MYYDYEYPDNIKGKIIKTPQNEDIIFIMTDNQKKMFENFPTVLMVDGTHETNSSNYILITGLIFDSRGEGFPIFQCFAKSETVSF